MAKRNLSRLFLQKYIFQVKKTANNMIAKRYG